MPLTLPTHMTFGASFFLSLFFGLVGTVYFMYGKKQEKYLCMFVGIVLGVYPYFISNAVMVFLVGLVLSALPFYINE